jgi:hypothetical protein
MMSTYPTTQASFIETLTVLCVNYPDPSKVQGSDEEKRKAFTDVMIGLKKHIELLVSMSLDKLGSVSLKEIHAKD